MRESVNEFLLFGLAFGLVFLFIFVFSFSVVNVSAESCWQYDSVAGGCTEANGCSFKNDSWGSWCEELSCWSLQNQSTCTDTNVPGSNCTWESGGVNFFCTELSCWAHSGTSANSCENNTASRSCNWNARCYSLGGSGCWDVTDQSICQNQTGCGWGTCDDLGCWGYGTESSCNNALDPWEGNNCTWTGSACNQRYCSDYGNQTACNDASGINCIWDGGGWCEEKRCSDLKNQTDCQEANATISEDCLWDGSFCREDNCWNYDSNEVGCTAKAECSWANWNSTGWCEDVNCWSWDTWNGGNQSDCEDNTYGFNCLWSGYEAGNSTDGWCYQDYSSTSCTNKTTERDCYDTSYCWWEANDWTNPSAGGNCSDPTWGQGTYGNVSDDILNDWNPGCYIFDNNETNCNNVLGCNYTNSECRTVAGGALLNHATNISNDGIACSYINESGLCNRVPILSNCCVWQNSSCSASRITTSCWEGLDQTPNGESSCEDATSQSSCSKLAQTPWYWPCNWDNTTSSTAKCAVKFDDIWGNGTRNLITIENRQTCEAVGGRWVTENYCEGTVSVPSGRCEYKFDEERNCNKACFACDYKNDGAAWASVTEARESCIGSTLGICKFTEDSSAANTFGTCKAKDQYKKGVAEDCDTSCGACTFKGDPDGINGTSTPRDYCGISLANSLGGGCKWIKDNSTSTLGYCVNSDERTCVDSCDRCYTQNDCSSNGRSALSNVSGSCKWQGGETDGSCVANVAGEVEICWNGEDDDNDGLTDCADPGCYSDSFCGFVEGDCFNWADNTSCIDNSCEWVVDKWGSWCDFPGSQCWKEDGNETACFGQSNCEWQNGTGSGWCEQDWSIAETCFGVSNETACGTVSNCVWTNDTWCNAGGNGSTWCENNGGWCDHQDFVYKDCWQYDSSSSECNGVTGCSWRNDDWSVPHCEVNWSGNCWNQTTSSACSSAGCWWSSNWNYCSNKMEECWQAADESSCVSDTTAACNWITTGTGTGRCEPSCFNSSLLDSQSLCDTVSGCEWKEETGWCEESYFSACSNSSSTGDEAICGSITGCEWRDPGWCSPKDGFECGTGGLGGGYGGSFGAECYKYDGNQSFCTNKTIVNMSCGWTTNNNPSCDVDWSGDCWIYNSVADGCTEDNGCWWNDQGNWCGNIADQCWNNQTLLDSATSCDANAYCNSTNYGCEPTCFAQGTISECDGIANDACKWSSGWCNPTGLHEAFDEIQAGAPVPIGVDVCDSSETSQLSSDICGFGMKDMGDSYGFGVNVLNFTNSSICNKEEVGIGSNVIGSGNDTIRYTVYLDTDGSSTGGCVLLNDNTAKGYEFRFRYSSEWNASKSKAAETYTSYKCDNSKWSLTDIKISTWKKIMCSDIGGPIIAIEKGELSRFPRLYDSTADIRVYVALAGNTGNSTNPTDTAGPGYATPGTIDFEIGSAFAYGADVAKFEDILKYGYTPGEDCFNSVDDDDDGTIDCNDWDCQYSSKCTTTGVNAAGTNDTRTPQVTGVKIEEYTNAALIMYDTNKPANGTLEFYYNDSRCLTLNKTIHDVGITSDNVREFKTWHKAEVYETPLGYSLTNDTTYYYKLKVCDDVGKCAKSRCSSFATPSPTKCGFCDFVTRIKTPIGWTVNYDVNQDGTYEHIQGQVCGPNSGMKTNYTLGRKTNVLLNKTDGSVYFEFINASLTKTGLNDKVRTIDTAGDIIASSTTVGLTRKTRDKIINNLHPEVCKVKVPFSGTCNKLYHCDDSGENCVERTSSATLLDDTNCVWQVPFCEFSTYREAVPVSSPGSSSSGSGGGSGGAGVISNATKKGDSSESGTEGTDSGSDGMGLHPEDGEGKEKEFGKFVWFVVGILIVVGVIGAYFYMRNRK
jgi:hypothetical protein